MEVRDQGLFNNSDEEEDDDDDDDEEDDGENDKEQLTEKQKRELRENEEKKESKAKAKAEAKKKSAETRAAAKTASQSQLTVANMESTGGTTVQAPDSLIAYVPPMDSAAFSDRPTTMDSEEMQAKIWQDDKDKIARKRLVKMRTVQHKIDNNLALERDIEEWLAVYDILASPSVFAQSGGSS